MARGYMPGNNNMQALLKQAQKAQRDMEQAQEKLAETEFTASAGGAVTVVVTGNRVVKSVKILPDAVSPDDVDMLEDMVLSAVNEALRQAEAAYEQAMGKVAGGLGGLF